MGVRVNLTALPDRGALLNPPNRFHPIAVEWDENLPPEERPDPRTRFFVDSAQTLVTRNDSPDIPFTHSVNPYRGCEHGCVYCYARPTHEYFGYSSGLDFESVIFVKTRAPELLRAELLKKRLREPLVFSGVTDCYQPAERRFELTRRCLEVLESVRHPVSLITKSRLITRDIDLLERMATRGQAAVAISLTTLDPVLARRLEPRASLPSARLDAIHRLSEAGIPTGVMTAPIIPGLNDHEIPALLDAAREAGASYAGWVLLRLPHAVGTLFHDWLKRHYPGRAEKVLTAIQETRAGELSDSRFGSRMRGTGPAAERIARLFEVAHRRAGYAPWHEPLVMDGGVGVYRLPSISETQLELFPQC